MQRFRNGGTCGIWEKKHNKKVGDYGSSATIIWTVAVVGNDGTCAFLMNGVWLASGFTDKFVVEPGYEFGFTMHWECICDGRDLDEDDTKDGTWILLNPIGLR